MALRSFPQKAEKKSCSVAGLFVLSNCALYFEFVDDKNVLEGRN
jgi:hypothetical protein